MNRSGLRKLAAILLAVVVCVILLLAGFACYQWGRASAQRDNGDQQNEIGGCRVSYRAELLDRPTLEGLAGAGRGDRPATSAAAESGLEGLDTYDRLVLLSRQDPEAFLERCRQRFG